MKRIHYGLIALAAAAFALPAAAYVGPGAGLSLLGTLWGLLVAVFLALSYVVMWPFRRLLRHRRGGRGAVNDVRDEMRIEDGLRHPRPEKRKRRGR
jgi:hypothetical protein